MRILTTRYATFEFAILGRATAGCPSMETDGAPSASAANRKSCPQTQTPPCAFRFGERFASRSFTAGECARAASISSSRGCVCADKVQTHAVTNSPSIFIGPIIAEFGGRLHNRDIQRRSFEVLTLPPNYRFGIDGFDGRPSRRGSGGRVQFRHIVLDDAIDRRNALHRVFPRPLQLA